MTEIRLSELRISARRVYDRRAGGSSTSALIVGRRVLPGVDHHPTSMCGGRWAWHIHLGLYAAPWRSAGSVPDIAGSMAGGVGEEEGVDKLRRSLERLRSLGLEPYEAWLCVEHGDCPDGVDYSEAFNTLMDYLEALGERGESPEEEWERRYIEELEARERRRVPVPA